MARSKGRANVPGLQDAVKALWAEGMSLDRVRAKVAEDFNMPVGRTTIYHYFKKFGPRPEEAQKKFEAESAIRKAEVLVKAQREEVKLRRKQSIIDFWNSEEGKKVKEKNKALAIARAEEGTFSTSTNMDHFPSPEYRKALTFVARTLLKGEQEEWPSEIPEDFDAGKYRTEYYGTYRIDLASKDMVVLWGNGTQGQYRMPARLAAIQARRQERGDTRPMVVIAPASSARARVVRTSRILGGTFGHVDLVNLLLTGKAKEVPWQARRLWTMGMMQDEVVEQAIAARRELEEESSSEEEEEEEDE